jgi:hypothetical protein
MFLLADVIFKWTLVYLRIMCEFLGWKRAEQWLRAIVHEEPDTEPERHVL